MIFPKEKWKDIDGYEGYYKISNRGRVKRLDVFDKNPKYNGNRLIKGGLRKSTIQSNGYKSVMLTKESKSKRFLIHRLVAIAFIPNPNEFPVVNHIDGNKLNNNVENLEWCTHSYNLKHAHSNGLLSNPNAIKKMNEINKKQVFCLEHMMIYESLTFCKSKFNYNISYLSQCCNHKKEKAYGLHWCYVIDLLDKMSYVKL